MKAWRAVPSATWIVGNQWLSVSTSARLGFYEDHPGGPALLHVEALEHAADAAPRTHTTSLPVNSARWGRGQALRVVVRRRRGQDDRERTGAGGDRDAVDAVGVAVVGGQGEVGRELAGLGRRRDAHHPRAQVVGGGRAGTVVAGGGRDEHARGVRVEEGQLGGVAHRLGATADRVVDDVDAVEDGLLGGRGRVGAVAARGAAHAVLGDLRTRGDAVDPGELRAERLHVVHLVAGGRGRRCASRGPRSHGQSRGTRSRCRWLAS